MSPEANPQSGYYELPVGQIRQGNIFRDVPRSVDFPPDAIAVENGKRFFVSGPFEPGLAILLSPSCSFSAQGVPGAYAHPFRQIAPIQDLESLVKAGAIKPAAVDQLRKYDHLRNYMYLPAHEGLGIPEACALIYAATAIHSEYLNESLRIAQLTPDAEVHMKRQLAAHASGSLFAHEEFDPDSRT